MLVPLVSDSRVISVNSSNDMIDSAKLLGYCLLPKGKKVGVVTFSGASSELAMGLLSDNGFEIAEFDVEVKKKMEREILPSLQPAKNPLDVWLALGADAESL